jgi:TadE-like protein
MRARAPTTREHRSRTDSGAVLLEVALVLPVAMLLFLGVLAVGSLLKAYSSTSHAVRVASRMASLAGADPMTDQEALGRLAREVAGIDPDVIQVVVVWHATGPGAMLPSGCRPAVHNAPNTTSVGVSDGGTDAVGACNVYVRPGDHGGAFDMATGAAPQPASYYFGCQGATDPLAFHKVDCRWPGKDRRAVTSPRSATGTLVAPDFVGIYLEVTHRFDLPALGSTITVSDHSVSLLEPHAYSV